MAEIDVKHKWRLGFHLMPPKGWLNDPNGLCQFHGVYHVFFQYSPDNPEGGQKYWGHYTSPDLLSWEFAGIALCPDETFDKNGVYSGSALIAEGQMHLYYTGNVKLEGDYNFITDGRQGNTIVVSSKDGITFGEKQCLLTNGDYPSNLTCHVRDPKTVTGESIGIMDGQYYTFLGARTKKDEGEVLLYKSSDLKNWELANTIKTDKTFGYMWECPDGFLLGAKKFLSISPQGVEPEGGNYQNIYQSGFYELEGDFAGAYCLKNFKEWDRGFDFYAPQTFLDESGRRILIGWVGMPDDPAKSNPTVEYGWQHALTVPREVFFEHGKVKQYPVKELLALRGHKHSLPNRTWSEEESYYDVEIEVSEEENLVISISGAVSLSYEKQNKIFTLQFDPTMNLGYGRDIRSVFLDQCKSVRILADSSCLEIYINGGAEVFTTRFYPKSGKSKIFVEQGASSAFYWPLRAMSVVEK